MSGFVGIDLGTTYSVVAYVNEMGVPVVIKNRAGQNLTPSVVAFTGATPLVGYEAKRRQEQGETEVAAFFKRSMGDPHVVMSFGGQDYTPIDLSALVLAHLKRQAEEALGTDVAYAVITVPAYFTAVQREATIEAGRRAGLTVLKIISEPTAAALAFGLRPGPGTRNILVYDLGGGTFDISLVRISESEMEVIGTDGNHRLGGKDWDDRLALFLQERFHDEFGADLIGDDANELLVQAEELKRTLSERQTAEFRASASGHSARYTITRQQFAGLSRDLLELTRQLTNQVRRDAGLEWTDIAGVLPVGGSTRMPMVAELIADMSGKPPMGGVHPDEAVALGAALEAAREINRLREERLPGASSLPALAPGMSERLPRAKVRDVVAHSLGMIAESAEHDRYLNAVLIRKNLKIPSEETRPFTMRARAGADTVLEVFLTQGETDDPRECAYVGRYVFTGFPPAAAGQEVVLDITYRYDQNATVEIAAVERATKTPLRMSAEPVPEDVPERFLGRPVASHAGGHMSVYLAFDLSGSMTGTPLMKAKEAAESFLSQCDLTSTAVGVIPFSDRVEVQHRASQNNRRVVHAIQALSVGQTGGGNSGHPFDVIYDELIHVEGRRYAIVLTDGVWSYQSLAIERARRCHEAGIQIVAIGFGSADERFLQQIASSNEMGFFTDLNQLGDTFSTIAQVLTEGGAEAHVGERLRSRHCLNT